jgi:PAS domain S-box-containing protein
VSLALCALAAAALGLAAGLRLGRRPAAATVSPAPAISPREAEEVETVRLRVKVRVAEEERERAMKAENLCRRVIDTTLDGVALLGPGLVIEHWNPQAAAIFGWSKEEAVGEPLLTLAVAEEHRDELRRVISGRARPSDTPLFSRRNEIRGLRKNGQEFPLEIAVTPLIHPGGGVAYSVFLRDITERKRVDRLKNEFVATVSHELRTPLTAIRGSLRLISGGFTGELPAKTRTMIDVAHESCERLVALVNDILDIEKIESGKMSFDLRPTDLGELAAKAVRSTLAYAAPFGVELREAVDSPCRALADEDRVIQVLTNLISNAVKFSPRGAAVDVRTFARDGRARIEVRDRGAGIPEEFRPRVFQKFAQADASNGRTAVGTGLGLNICKAIIERHGGSIGFETEMGRGTTFWFELPGAAPRAPRAEAEERPSILIVERDAALAAQLSESCRDYGFQVEVVASAAPARERLAAGGYAALVLDLEAPEVEGLDFLRGLRRGASAPPTIVLSGRRQETGRFTNGADHAIVVDWLNKPLEAARFESLLRGLAAAESPAAA